MVHGKWYIVLAFVLSACTQVPEVEKTIHVCASAPQARACAMSYAHGKWINILCGRTQDGTYPTTALRYNTLTDEWTETGTLPIPARVNGTLCATDQGVFLGLGYAGGLVHQDSNYLHDWWKIDYTTLSFQRLADFPAPQTVAPVSWYDGQHIWIACGFHEFTNDIWCYDIASDTWSKSSRLSPMRVMSAVVASCEGRTFIGTGFHTQSQSEWFEWTADEAWHRRASVPGKGRHNAACGTTDHAVWIIGGWHYGDSLTTGFHYEDILRYSPSEDTWTLCGTIPCGTTENGVACGIGNKLYFGLGEDKNGQLHTNWYYIED